MAKGKYSIEDMQEYAKTHGGKCLSKEFKGINHPLLWECSFGHKWETRPFSYIYNKSWCKTCANIEKAEKKRLGLEVFKKIAKEKGGELLSTEYKNQHTKMMFRCNQGHDFEAVGASIKNMGTWCSICSKGLSERICGKYFEYIFNKKFPKRYPKWMLSEKGYPMELDGYCVELQIAFEYQGEQHFTSRYFGKNPKFKRIQKRDILKKKLCKENGVNLITIPFWIKYEDMQNYIVEQCKALRIPVPEVEYFDYKKFNVYSPERLKEMQELAKRKGGKCLSKQYVNTSTKLLFECKNGHEFLMIPPDVKGGHWCPHCAGVGRLSLKIIQQKAKEMGGECLSTTYINNKTPMKFRCGQGHDFETRPDVIMRGHFCRECGYIKQKYKKFPHKHKF